MKMPIDHASPLGIVKRVRANHKLQKIHQGDAVGSIGVSENLLGTTERGSEQDALCRRQAYYKPNPFMTMSRSA